MENELRDLEMIQEKNLDDAGRRVGLILLAAIVVIGLTFAMGIMVGRAARPDIESFEDPLARIDKETGRGSRDDQKSDTAPQIKREELTFPTVLTEKQDPPEVTAAIAAAAAEEAALVNKLNKLNATAQLENPTAAAFNKLNSTAPTGEKEVALINRPGAKPEKSGEIAPVPTEKDGEYALQIVSYERSDPAHAFAKGLRARGYRAFVTGTEVPDRGHYYRVRIGFFGSRSEADLYRRKFEQQEHMNAIVVRKEKS